MDNFTKRGDHIVGSFIGATFLGVILGQLPGAVIGGTIGLIYAMAHGRSSTIATLPKEKSHMEKDNE